MKRFTSLSLVLLCLCRPSAADPAHIRTLGFTASKLRHLSYRPVKSQEVTQAQCGAYVTNLVNTELQPVVAARQEALLRHLGLLSGKKDMRAIYIDLLTDQVRGLYDPKKKRFLVVHGQASNLMERGMGALFSMMGVNIEDIFTVHEMTHAVQDQHFNLDKISTQTGGDFDRALAAQSLFEGDASVIMWEYAFAKLPPNKREGQIAAVSHYQMGMDEGNPLGTSAAMTRTPRFFREALTFPYIQGSAFVNALRARGGWAAVDHAFRHLPESSEQIFHPEKYGVDHPRRVKMDPLSPGKNWKSLGQDTGGEFTVRVWAHSGGYDPDKVTGWSGDRYQVWSRGKATLAVWDTYWDNDAASRFFEKVAVYCLSRKRTQRTWKELDPKTSQGVWGWQSGGLITRCQRKGNRVRLILDFPADFTPPEAL